MVRTELGCKLLGFPLILIISLFLADLLVFFFLDLMTDCQAILMTFLLLNLSPVKHFNLLILKRLIAALNF